MLGRGGGSSHLKEYRRITFSHPGDMKEEWDSMPSDFPELQSVSENFQDVRQLIPEFKGYSDIRTFLKSDSRLRNYVAKKLRSVREQVDGWREHLIASMNIDIIDEVGRFGTNIRMAETLVRSSGQESLQMTDGDQTVPMHLQESLYAKDMNLFTKLQNLERSVDILQNTILSINLDQLKEYLSESGNKLEEFTSQFQTRSWEAGDIAAAQ